MMQFSHFLIVDVFSFVLSSCRCNNESDEEEEEGSESGGGDKEYKCSQCPKVYNWKSNLIRHQVSHDDSRRYVCESCKKVFTDPSNLQRHIRSQHIGARCHACPECGKTFATSSGLKQHTHIHSSVKPFRCEVCLKAYTQFSNLCRHKRMHATCRLQIKCSKCGQAFSTVTSLSKHKRFCEGPSSLKTSSRESLASLPSSSLHSPLNQHLDHSLFSRHSFPSLNPLSALTAFGSNKTSFPFVSPSSFPKSSSGETSSFSDVILGHSASFSAFSSSSRGVLGISKEKLQDHPTEATKSSTVSTVTPTDPVASTKGLRAEVTSGASASGDDKEEATSQQEDIKKFNNKTKTSCEERGEARNIKKTRRDSFSSSDETSCSSDPSEIPGSPGNSLSLSSSSETEQREEEDGDDEREEDTLKKDTKRKHHRYPRKKCSDKKLIQKEESQEPTQRQEQDQEALETVNQQSVPQEQGTSSSTEKEGDHLLTSQEILQTQAEIFLQGLKKRMEGDTPLDLSKPKQLAEAMAAQMGAQFASAFLPKTGFPGLAYPRAIHPMLNHSLLYSKMGADHATAVAAAAAGLPPNFPMFPPRMFPGFPPRFPHELMNHASLLGNGTNPAALAAFDLMRSHLEKSQARHSPSTSSTSSNHNEHNTRSRDNGNGSERQNENNRETNGHSNGNSIRHSVSNSHSNGERRHHLREGHHHHHRPTVHAPIHHLGSDAASSHHLLTPSMIKSKERYCCKYCGKVFPRSANLTRHLRTHTGEQPYKCRYCERSFSISSNLQRHVRNIHNKEKPFKCPLCDRRFGQQTNLDRHLKKHESDGPTILDDSPKATSSNEADDKDDAYMFNGLSDIRNFMGKVTADQRFFDSAGKLLSQHHHPFLTSHHPSVADMTHLGFHGGRHLSHHHLQRRLNDEDDDDDTVHGDEEDEEDLDDANSDIMEDEPASSSSPDKKRRLNSESSNDRDDDEAGSVASYSESISIGSESETVNLTANHNNNASNCNGNTNNNNKSPASPSSSKSSLEGNAGRNGRSPNHASKPKLDITSIADSLSRRAEQKLT